MKRATTPIASIDTPIGSKPGPDPVASSAPPAAPAAQTPGAMPKKVHAAIVGPDGVPLSADSMKAIARAQKHAKRIRTATFLATFNFWSAAIFAGFTCLYAVVSLAFGSVSIVALTVGAGLSIIASNELRGRRMLQQFNLRGPRLLGWNQIGYLALITVYCAFRVSHTLAGDGEYGQIMMQHPELSDFLEPVGEMMRWGIFATYVLIFVISSVVMGGNAIYYFTRRKHLQAYLDETPAWVVDFLRRAS